MDGSVANAIELIDRLSTSRQTHDCMVEQLYQYAMHRAPESGDEEHLADLREAFWSDGGTIPNLYLRIVTHPSFSTIPIPEGEAS